jgi:hypothetical protein
MLSASSEVSFKHLPATATGPLAKVVHHYEPVGTSEEAGAAHSIAFAAVQR